ncbi:MAG: hypothetical protein ACLTSZ_03060 [Lachnospiraceae bacterium]
MSGSSTAEILANFDGRPFHDGRSGFVYVYPEAGRDRETLLREDKVDAVEWMPYEKRWRR